MLSIITNDISIGDLQSLTRLNAGLIRGFDFIVNVSKEVISTKHFNCMSIPFFDGEPIPDGCLTLAFDTLDYAHRKGYNTLVHCYAGQSRSPAVVVAYLAVTMGISYDQAMNYVASKRPMAQLHPAIEQSVRKWLDVDGIKLRENYPQADRD